MDLTAQLGRLARFHTKGAPVVSVYLNTGRTDEHQPDRARLFLKNELRQARQADVEGHLTADLDWIQEQAEALLAGTESAESRGVAFFACQAAGMREIVPVRIPLANAFVVGPSPSVRGLAAVAHEAPATVVLFVDAVHARIVRLSAQGPLEEITLESDLPRRDERSEWARATQARYEQHIRAYRDRHFEAVVESLLRLVERHGVRWIVLAGEPRSVGELRAQLPRQLTGCMLGNVAGTRHDSANALADRAAELLRRLVDSTEAPAVDAALTEAAKGGRAVAGVEATLEAINRGAVHQLYMLEAFKASGSACGNCHVLGAQADDACPVCGGATERIDLGEAMVNRALTMGSAVDSVGTHGALERAGGVAAWLRYPIQTGGSRR